MEWLTCWGATTVISFLVESGHGLCALRYDTGGNATMESLRAIAGNPQIRHGRSGSQSCAVSAIWVGSGKDDESTVFESRRVIFLDRVESRKRKASQPMQNSFCLIKITALASQEFKTVLVLGGRCWTRWRQKCSKRLWPCLPDIKKLHISYMWRT